MNPKLRVAMLAVMLVAVVGFMVVVARRSPPVAAPLPPGPRVVAKPVAVRPPDPAVAAIATVQDGGRSYEDRLKAVQGLSRTLTAEQCAALRQLVRDPGVHPSIRNDALNALERQEANPPAGLATDLVAAWNNPKEDATWRDFALQHLAAVYGRATPAERQQAEATLVAAAKDQASPSAGTALLSLERLGKQNPALQQTAQGIAKDAQTAGGTDEARRVTAMCVRIDAGDREVLPQARQAAQNTSVEVRVRMTCVGAIGQMGDATDIPLLEALAKDKESRIRTVAANQLANLKRRLGQP